MNCVFRVAKNIQVAAPTGMSNIRQVQRRCGKRGHLYLQLQIGNRIKYLAYCKEHQNVVTIDAANHSATVVDLYHEWLVRTAKKVTVIDEKEVPQYKRNQYKETKDRIKRIMKQKNNAKVDWDTLFDEILKEFLVESVMEG